MLKKPCFLVSVFFFISLCSCQTEEQPNSEAKSEAKAENKIEIKSTAFDEGGMIPKQYTCDGIDVSPPLAWSSVPEGTQGLALIVDDPDAPGGTWVHWVLFNLAPDTKELNENIPPQGELPVGAKQGKNDFGKIGYGGPCPPDGTHRYYFKLYVLDVEIKLEPGITKADLVKAMEGHIVAEGQLMGRYKR